MTLYYENPELKRSSCVILILAIIFMVINFFILNRGYERVKEDYINNNAALVGKIVKIHPELKYEVVSIITKGSSQEDIEFGRKILNNYDYKENLNINLLPELKADYSNLNKSVLFSMACFFIIVFLINSIEYVRMYKKLESLMLAAKNIIDYNFDVGIYENTEGIFAKLAHTFNNMRVILKNNLIQIQKEKNFLINTLSDISHQIKTPISSLIIYNDILLNRKINEEKKIEFLRISQNQLNRIQWLVKSLLQLARLDVGAVKFEIKSNDINKTVTESIESLKIKSENANVEVEFYPEENEIMVNHDPNWINEAIINIIKNAIEHTKPGGKVQIFTEKSQVCSRIIVKDNGEGIHREEIKHIFERFYKGRTNRNEESIGIGLALSKSIIEGNKGMINVKSKMGKGTTFEVIFLNRFI
ncbi:sensor histidine kinase [Clostridium sp. BJN0013]|uniref:sensor histidine kinase n=1 Tax=Clostridium sp. BJN0013 TaxID=3236840 RepID=UPI0034C5BD03